MQKIWQRLRNAEPGQNLSADQRPARIVSLSSGAIAGVTGFTSVFDSLAGLYDFAVFDLVFALLSLVPVWLNRKGRPGFAALYLLVLAHTGALFVSPMPGEKQPQDSVYAILLLLTFIVLYHRGKWPQMAGLAAVPFSYFIIQPFLINADVRPNTSLTPWQTSYSQVVMVMGSFVVASMMLFAIFRNHRDDQGDEGKGETPDPGKNRTGSLAAKSQFLSVISHEIRNPLTTINYLSEALERESTLGQTARKTLRSIRNSTEFLASLLTELLDLSRLEAGAARISTTPFSPRQQLEDAAAPFAALAAAKHLGFHVEADAGLPDHVTGDPLRLTQILTNLCANAVKFTAHGRVTVSAASQGTKDGMASILYRVADTGIGMTETEKTAVLQPFVQANAGISAKFGGTGLGLSIAKDLLHLMGSDLVIHSALGAGSEFSFTLNLPVYQHALN